MEPPGPHKPSLCIVHSYKVPQVDTGLPAMTQELRLRDSKISFMMSTIYC